MNRSVLLAAAIGITIQLDQMTRPMFSTVQQGMVVTEEPAPQPRQSRQPIQWNPPGVHAEMPRLPFRYSSHIEIPAPRVEVLREARF